MHYELKRDEIGKLRLTLNMEFNSLADAMETLSLIEKHGGNSSLSSMELELLPFLKEGKLLQAVKYHKDRTGWGLKESKGFCDELRDKLQKMNII
jgi:ribosomal protein L7/L12